MMPASGAGASDAGGGTAAWGGPVVDVHAHAFPMPLLKYLESRGLADLSGIDAGVLLLEPAVSGVARGARLPLRAEQYDVPRRLDSMTEAGVSAQLVSAPPFVFGSMAENAALVMDIARRSNDALAEYVAEAPDRMRALGTVPVGVPGAADEAVRCLDELDMAGLTMGTYGGGHELDDSGSEDLWELVSRRRAFCLIHPSRASSPERLRDYYLVQLLGYPAETALAAARLVFGGVLDRHDPVLCLAHGGGCLPGLVPRLDLGWHRKAQAHTAARTPSDYLRRFHYDTAVFDATALTRLVNDVGYQQVLLGTDMPFDLADTDAVARIRDSITSPDAVEAILAGNAQRLVRALRGGGAGSVRATRGGRE